MVRKRYNAAKRTYSRAKGGLSTILQNPIAIGAITGVIKNTINGQPPINIYSIQRRISLPNAKNPLIYLLAGYFLKNIRISQYTSCSCVCPFHLVFMPSYHFILFLYYLLILYYIILLFL